MATTHNPKTEQQLAEAVSKFYNDPLGFVMFAYPWGEDRLADGSQNPLRERKGPEKWQRELLEKLGNQIKYNTILTSAGLDREIGRYVRASGHGVGKSAIVAWLIHFFMATRPDTRIGVTANTANQLETKTWPELAKWHKLFICKHWFTWTATTYYFTLYPEDQRKNYMAVASTVSEDNTEAFAGLHNEGKTVVIIFDEASGIGKKIWEVSEGALTDGEGFFFGFGNPTQPDGEFYECFTNEAYMPLYDRAYIDSREVSFTNKSYLREMIGKYGEDSDWVSVRVKGQFPTQAFNGFIGPDIVALAIDRELVIDLQEPKILGVDIARYGSDNTVWGIRQGRDFRSFKQITMKGLSIVRSAKMTMEITDLYQPDGLIIESTGVGAGVVDICRDKGYRVVEVHPGSPSMEPMQYVNKRAELWGKMRDWLYEKGCIPDDPELVTQLVSLRYSFDRKEQRIQIEGKQDMKERTGLSSPDKADSLALTFGATFARRDRDKYGERPRNQAKMEDDPLPA